MADLHVNIQTAKVQVEAFKKKGQTLMFLAQDKEFCGLVRVGDSLKKHTKEAIHQMTEEGLEIIMVTGDSKGAAEAIGKQVGLSNIIAEVLPEQKAEIVSHLRSKGKVVAMAGDGINDAPALSLADVGVAMGTGTDIAIESADVTLVKGDLRGILRARRLSQKVMKNIKQNLFFAFVYNTLGVPIAAGLFFPIFGWLLSPMLAAAAHEP